MRLRFAALLAFVVFAFAGLLWPAPIAAHANLDRSEPVARSAVAVSPSEIRLFFTEPPELRYSEIVVYDANLQHHEQGSLRAIPGDSLGMAISVQQLPEGIYTVAWKALSSVDGHETQGSFAFAVGNIPPPATVGIDDQTKFTLPTPQEVIAKWLTILAATALVGALGLRLLVWRPILLESDLPEDGDFARRLSRRLVRLAGGALLLLIVSTAVALVLQAAKVGGKGLGGVNGTLLNDYLLNTRGGAIWLTRLLIPIVALMLLAPLLIAAFRRNGPRPDPDDDDATPTLAPLGPLAFGVVLGAAYLLTISLISHSAAVGFWVPFNVGMDWLHLLAVAFWIGGVLGLVLTAPLVGELGAATRPVLGRLVARFSTIGLASVGILGVTGLYSSWLHVGSLDALFQTDYGRALAGKLVLFAFLVLLGALNKFWVGPRLAAQPAAPSKRRAKEGEERAGRVSQLLLRYFGRIVRAEALLGIAIIAIVAVLTGLVPAREAIVQSRLPKRTQTITTGNVKVTLTLGALQPGDNTFDIYLAEKDGGKPIANADEVALRIAHTGMDMGEAEAKATSQGNGHYVANGPYLTMSGDWDLRVLARRPASADIDATFDFPIGSAANLQSASTKLTAPQLPQLNSQRGVGLISLAVGVILAAFGVRLFRRGSGWGTAMLMLVPTTLVVGGYLVYNGSGNEPLLNAPLEPNNPVAADATSIADGQQLFATNCVVCHGAQGRGNGPQAGTLNPRPPNMADPHTAYHTDGYLYNAITNGFPGSEMPAWGDTFTERQKWDLVNYIRQFNPLTANGATPPPSTPPDLHAARPTPGHARRHPATSSARPSGTPAAFDRLTRHPRLVGGPDRSRSADPRLRRQDLVVRPPHRRGAQHHQRSCQRCLRRRSRALTRRHHPRLHHRRRPRAQPLRRAVRAHPPRQRHLADEQRRQQPAAPLHPRPPRRADRDALLDARRQGHRLHLQRPHPRRRWALHRLHPRVAAPRRRHRPAHHPHQGWRGPRLHLRRCRDPLRLHPHRLANLPAIPLGRRRERRQRASHHRPRPKIPLRQQPALHARRQAHRLRRLRRAPGRHPAADRTAHPARALPALAGRTPHPARCRRPRSPRRPLVGRNRRQRPPPDHHPQRRRSPTRLLAQRPATRLPDRQRPLPRQPRRHQPAQDHHPRQPQRPRLGPALTEVRSWKCEVGSNATVAPCPLRTSSFVFRTFDDLA
ncbi:MAG: CopD family protein [Chloroflexia bacterium]